VWNLIEPLGDCIPAGSQLVLITRAEPDLMRRRARNDTCVHLLTAGELAFDPTEAAALFVEAGSRGRVVDAARSLGLLEA
jgi:hypothetical protein